MKAVKNIRVMISGGGTGGHIFPAIAIAKAIERAMPNTEFLFIGAKDKMEMLRVPEAGYKIEGLWISGIQRKLSFQNLSFPFKLISSLLKARKLIKKFAPHMVIGVGGFASGPTLRMAASMGIPCLIQEQNSYPGITNKLLANKVRKICVAYEGMEKYFPKEKIVLTGNPIRKEVTQIEGKKDQAIKFFNLRKDLKTILIVGGSLGAQSVNRAIIKDLEKWGQQNLQLIWQSGKTSYNECFSALNSAAAPNIHLHEFIKEMDLAYAAADLIVSRAGAIAISEISIVGKPVIFVPFPYAAEDHQTKNALQLVNNGAAKMISDNLVSEELFEQVTALILDGKRCNQMGKEIKKLGIVDADDLIAKEIIQLIK